MLLSLTSFNKPYRYVNLFLLVSFFLLGQSGCRSGARLEATPGVVADTKPVQILVWDDAKQVPLKRANVTLTIPNNIFPAKETDDSGRAVFDVRQELLSLTATILIQKEGYQSQSHIVTLANAPVITVYLVLNNATAVPRATPSVTPIPLTPQQNDTATPLPTATATATNTPIPPTPTFTQTSTLPPLTDDVKLTRREGADTVFVLAGPDVSNVQLGTLGADETAEIIGRTEQNEWLQIITERGVEGWVAYCEVILSVPDLEDVPIIWNGSVTPKICGDVTMSGTSVPVPGNCVNVILSRTDWPGKAFDDVLLSWSNVPSAATQLKLSVSGSTNEGGTDYVVDPTFSDTDIGYKVELFMFEDGDFKPGATYTFVVQPVNASGGIICTTQGTFIP